MQLTQYQIILSKRKHDFYPRGPYHHSQYNTFKYFCYSWHCNICMTVIYMFLLNTQNSALALEKCIQFIQCFECKQWKIKLQALMQDLENAFVGDAVHEHSHSIDPCYVVNCVLLYFFLLLCIQTTGSGSRFLGKPVTFISHPHCRAALDLRPGKTYLIMGGSKDIHRDEQSRS